MRKREKHNGVAVSLLRSRIVVPKVESQTAGLESEIWLVEFEWGDLTLILRISVGGEMPVKSIRGGRGLKSCSSLNLSAHQIGNKGWS